MHPLARAATLAALLFSSVAPLAPLAPLAAQQTADGAPTARIIPARCADAACGGDYQLAIVAALYPYDDGTIRGPGVLTLVIENRGSAAAPLTTLEAAPVARLANAAFSVARRAPVAALLPGERTVVEIPLTVGADGAVPCLSISVSPNIVPTPAQTQFYAAGPATSSRTTRSSLAPSFASVVGEGF